MFSIKEKQLIAKVVEDILLYLKHPEMPTEKLKFKLHIDGKEAWSFADIEPNWIYKDGKKSIGTNPWNEVSRVIMKPKDKTKCE